MASNRRMSPDKNKELHHPWVKGYPYQGKVIYNDYTKIGFFDEMRERIEKQKATYKRDENGNPISV